jgi:hypothetical protein
MAVWGLMSPSVRSLEEDRATTSYAVASPLLAITKKVILAALLLLPDRSTLMSDDSRTRIGFSDIR